MKQITTIVHIDKMSQVVTAVREAGAKGVSVTEVNGQGSGERPMMRGGRGTTQYRAEFNKMVSIMTLVEDSQVPVIVDAINGSAYTGKAGDGIIVVTNVDEIINIASKNAGSKAL
jgi:nitrogen regulatory protein PII